MIDQAPGPPALETQLPLALAATIPRPQQGSRSRGRASQRHHLPGRLHPVLRASRLPALRAMIARQVSVRIVHFGSIATEMAYPCGVAFSPIEGCRAGA